MSFLVLSILAVLAVTCHGTEYLDIEPNAPGINLWPQTTTGFKESRWVLKGCDGCKLIVSCVLLRTSCEDHKLIIYDGNSTSTICGPDQDYVLKSSSNSKMIVTVQTTTLKHGSFCKASSTKPYLNDVFVKRDSSEDGQGVGSKSPSCKCGWTNKPKNRIVGGNEASPNEYPFAVLLGIRRTNYQFCGGSIISPQHVLTAAHCTKPFRGIKLSVYVGEHDTTLSASSMYTAKIDVKKAYDHPDYDDRVNINDISVLHLVSEIQFNKFVGPVCLPTGKRDIMNSYIKVMGWGHVETKGAASPKLRKVDVKAIDWDICKTIYHIKEVLRPTQICSWAPNRDSCQGDSGGPLVLADDATKRLIQVAVVSYGRDCASTDPAVNTNVSHFMDWVNSVIKETGGTVCTA